MDENNNEDWMQEFLEDFEKADRRNKYVERGKLGGRPKVSAPKSERLALRFTETEMKMLKEFAEKKKMKLTDYSRVILLEKRLPDYEKNIMLTEYATNFRRISNYMKREIFNAEERGLLLKEIEAAIQGIKKEIQW